MRIVRDRPRRRINARFPSAARARRESSSPRRAKGGRGLTSHRSRSAELSRLERATSEAKEHRGKSKRRRVFLLLQRGALLPAFLPDTYMTITQLRNDVCVLREILPKIAPNIWRVLSCMAHHVDTRNFQRPFSRACVPVYELYFTRILSSPRKSILHRDSRV